MRQTAVSILRLRALLVLLLAAMAVGLLALVGTKPAGAATQFGFARSDFPVGSFPFEVTSAHFNDDSHLDLAVTNFSSQTVSVLLGNGSGSFGLAPNFCVCAIENGPHPAVNPSGITSADFDGDSDLDLAVTDHTFDENGAYLGTVSVLFNDGSGSFDSPNNFNVAVGGDSPFGIISEDFDNVNGPDLAVVNTDSNNVSVLLNNGSGSFNSPNTVGVGSSPSGIASADFDGDSDLDLAVANSGSGNVSMLFNDGSGSFDSPNNFNVAVGDSPFDITSENFNDDNHPDLAVANTGSGTVSVLLNNGSGSFGTANTVGVGSSPVGIASGDFDGDSDLDLAVDLSVPNAGPGIVSVLFGDGSGSFGPATNVINVGAFPQGIASAAFNSDGKKDLAVANSGSNNVSVLLANFSPSATGDSYSVNEDQTLTVPDGPTDVLANDTDPENNSLTAIKVSDPTNGTLNLNSNGSFTYTPQANFSGTDSFTYKANDGSLDSDPATVSITVNPVNDAPSFTKGADQTVNEDAGAQTVSGWATNISRGPSDESGQTVSFDVSNNNNSLFSTQPAVSSSGTLSYTPAPNATGTATVTVTAKDNGGTANGGVNTSASQTFTITVNSVNDLPSISDITDKTIDQNTDTGEIPFTVGDTETAAKDLTVTGSSSNTTLVPNSNIVIGPASPTDGNRTVKVTPVTDKAGTATITVRVSDGTDEATDTFILTVLDTTGPTVTVTKPTTRSGNITLQFSEPMKPSTLMQVLNNDPTQPSDSTTIRLFKGKATTPVSAKVRCANASCQTVTLDPFGPTSTQKLAKKTTYTVKITGGPGGVKDLADKELVGNQPSGDHFTSFKTGRK